VEPVATLPHLIGHFGGGVCHPEMSPPHNVPVGKNCRPAPRQPLDNQQNFGGTSLAPIDGRLRGRKNLFTEEPRARSVIDRWKE
jgi:hypothetical protein